MKRTCVHHHSKLILPIGTFNDFTLCTVIFKADSLLKGPILSLKYKVFSLKFMEFGLSVLSELLAF